jgi:serine/threonine kinase 16
VLNQIAEGGFAYVSRVKSVNLSDFGQRYAVKLMICQSQEQLSEARKEVKLMRLISHNCVVPLLAVDEKKNSRGHIEVMLLLPLYIGSLQNFIDKGEQWPHCAFEDSATVARILIDSTAGIAALHAAGYRHSDIKPGNILLSRETLSAVITDLGSASPLVVHVSSRREALTLQESAAQFSTASYRAPELHDTPSECTIDGKADVWALGCVLFATCFSRSPFESPSGLSTLALLAGTLNFPPRHPWPEEWLRLIESCLRADCTARADMNELKSRLSALPKADLMAPCLLDRTFIPLSSVVPPGECNFADFSTFSGALASSLTTPAPAPAPVPPAEDEDVFGEFTTAF